MRIFMKAAASASAVGLLAFGAAGIGGGAALASPARSGAAPATTGSGQSVTACSAEYGGVAVGLFPKCTAGNATVDNPTSIAINLNTTALGTLINAVPGLGLKASWTLSCVVDGSPVTSSSSFTVTTLAQSATRTIDLQTAVGSPDPNTCTVENLTATTTLAVTVGLPGLPLITVGAGATATTAVPGAIYQDEGTTGSGAHAVLCADDTGNGNAGSKIQAFQCLSDLADYFVQTSSGQLVHNGDCLGLSGNRVVLDNCDPSASSQHWSQTTIGGRIQNQSGNVCLTAPSAKDGTQLTVTSCGSGANQKWRLPAVSA